MDFHPALSWPNGGLANAEPPMEVRGKFLGIALHQAKKVGIQDEDVRPIVRPTHHTTARLHHPCRCLPFVATRIQRFPLGSCVRFDPRAVATWLRKMY